MLNHGRLYCRLVIHARLCTLVYSLSYFVYSFRYFCRSKMSCLVHHIHRVIDTMKAKHFCRAILSVCLLFPILGEAKPIGKAVSFESGEYLQHLFSKIQKLEKKHATSQ